MEVEDRETHDVRRKRQFKVCPEVASVGRNGDLVAADQVGTVVRIRVKIDGEELVAGSKLRPRIPLVPRLPDSTVIEVYKDGLSRKRVSELVRY